MIWLISKILIQAFVEIDKVSVKNSTDFFIYITNLNISQWKVYCHVNIDYENSFYLAFNDVNRYNIKESNDDK